MPIYQYECSTCGTVFDKRQGFHDEPVAECPNGHSDTRRLIAMPAIVFKGSGFYINDSKGDKTSANGVSKDKGSEGKSGTDKSEKKSQKSDSKAESKSSESSKNSESSKSSNE